MNGLTHASFFSGVGGLDLGLERAGWRTVSFSEIDPYASAVLAQRWPGIPNLGDIVQLAGGIGRGPEHRNRDSTGTQHESVDWHSATLWTGGFPCQDLSVAGKRRGLAGERSGLAFSFLDLVGRHRPRFVLLENVPGLLSSHGGKDFGTLLAALVELGYGVGYRVLDARYFGVPQRRRRVFILGDSAGGRAGAERAAEVLSVGSRCRRHPPTGIEAGEGIAERPGRGIAHALSASRTRSGRFDSNGETYAISPSPDSHRMREADGLAGRSHDRGGVADTLREHPRPGSNGNGALVTTFAKRHRATSVDDSETWEDSDIAPTLNDFDTGDSRAVALAVGAGGMTDDPLLPLGLDSHRYRCCGNGVISDMAFWIGMRLRAAIESAA